MDHIKRSGEGESTPLTPKTNSQAVSAWRRRLLLLVVVATLGVGLDQGSKVWVQTSLARVLPASFSTTRHVADRSGPVYVPTRHVVVIPGLFDLRYVENSAAAFSLTRSIPQWIRMPLLITVSSTAIVFFLWWYLTLQQASRFLLLSFCMVVAGAMGNLLDRARLGYVIDFLHFYAGFAGYPEVYWPTFNVADSLIVVGASGILLHTFVGHHTPASHPSSSCHKEQPTPATAA